MDKYDFEIPQGAEVPDRDFVCGEPAQCEGCDCGKWNAPVWQLNQTRTHARLLCVVQHEDSADLAETRGWQIADAMEVAAKREKLLAPFLRGSRYGMGRMH